MILILDPISLPSNHPPLPYQMEMRLHPRWKCACIPDGRTSGSHSPWTFFTLQSPSMVIKSLGMPSSGHAWSWKEHLVEHCGEEASSIPWTTESNAALTHWLPEEGLQHVALNLATWMGTFHKDTSTQLVETVRIAQDTHHLISS